MSAHPEDQSMHSSAYSGQRPEANRNGEDKVEMHERRAPVDGAIRVVPEPIPIAQYDASTGGHDQRQNQGEAKVVEQHTTTTTTTTYETAPATFSTAVIPPATTGGNTYETTQMTYSPMATGTSGYEASHTAYQAAVDMPAYETSSGYVGTRDGGYTTTSTSAPTTAQQTTTALQSMAYRPEYSQQTYQTTGGYTGSQTTGGYTGSQAKSNTYATGQTTGGYVTGQTTGGYMTGQTMGGYTTGESYPVHQHQTTTTTYPGQTTATGGKGYHHAVQYPHGLPDNAYEAETRKVSSVVLESTPLEAPPQGDVRYVEIPTYEDVVKYVKKEEYREVKRVVEKPVYEVEYVDQYVKVPQYVDKVVERPVEQVVYRDVPVQQFVDRPVYVEVPKTVKKVVQRVQEVPVPVVRERVVDQYVDKPVQQLRFQDNDVPVIVAQTVRPVITESDRRVTVDVLDYEPEVVPVDVHIAKPVKAVVENVGRVDARHRLVNITSGQYNTILKLLNQHMDENTRATLPFVAENGRVPFIPEHEAKYIVAPPDTVVENWNRPAFHHQVDHNSRVRSRGIDESSALVDARVGRSKACCGGESQPKQTTTVATTETAYSQQAGKPYVTYQAQQSQLGSQQNAEQVGGAPFYGSQMSQVETRSHQSNVVVAQGSQGASYVSKSGQQQAHADNVDHQSNLSFKPSGQTKRTTVCC